MQKNCKCGKIINYNEKECEECSLAGRGDYYRGYDSNRTDDGFYKARAWQTTREIVRHRDGGLCKVCLDSNDIVTGDTVHHIEPLEDNRARGYDTSNLITVCRSCHGEIHNEYDKDESSKVKEMNRLYSLIDC